jgi:hypothetical protein
MGVGRSYHLEKTLKCAEKGIRLIHICETEWNSQKHIVLSLINRYLDQFNILIDVDHCDAKEITKKEKDVFLENNHLQGSDLSNVQFGLFNNDDLVLVITFTKRSYGSFVLNRICVKTHCEIDGGFKKLWDYFLKTYDVSKITYFLNMRYDDERILSLVGFTKVKTTPPNFHIFGKFLDGLVSIDEIEHHWVKSHCVTYSSKLSVWENLKNNGYNRIWDCGIAVFEWKKCIIS